MGRVLRNVAFCCAAVGDQKRNTHVTNEIYRPSVSKRSILFHERTRLWITGTKRRARRLSPSPMYSWERAGVRVLPHLAHNYSIVKEPSPTPLPVYREREKSEQNAL